MKINDYYTFNTTLYLSCVVFILLFAIICMHACLYCESVHMNILRHRGQKRASNLLELELQVVMSHPTWVLGTGLEWLLAGESFLQSPCLIFFSLVYQQ